MVNVNARKSVGASFLILSSVGASFIFWRWSGKGSAVAFCQAAIFVVVMAAVHGAGFILYEEQKHPKSVEATLQSALHGISPLYWAAFREAAFAQSLLGIPMALLLDGGRTFSFFIVALLSDWVCIILIVARRPMTPTKFDLSFIRIGILPMCILTGAIAPLIWRIIGESDRNGLQRLLGN
jgi:hypothetical protein